MSWDPNYNATQDPNSSDDYSSGQDNYSRGYYSLECHMQGLDLTSCQHYGVRYGCGHRPQLERSASTSTSFSTYRRDNYDDDFVPHHNSMSTLCRYLYIIL